MLCSQSPEGSQGIHKSPRWESSQGRREDRELWVFSFCIRLQPRLDSEHQVGWIPAPVRAVPATFLCHKENIKMSVIYRCNNFGLTAVGSYLERKHFPITFYLKNSRESLEFSITSRGIEKKKKRILPLSCIILIPHCFQATFTIAIFLLKQKGGKKRALGKNWLWYTSIPVLLVWRKLQDFNCCEQCVTVATLHIPDKWQEQLQKDSQLLKHALKKPFHNKIK